MINGQSLDIRLLTMNYLPEPIRTKIRSSYITCWVLWGGFEGHLFALHRHHAAHNLSLLSLMVLLLYASFVPFLYRIDERLPILIWFTSALWCIRVYFPRIQFFDSVNTYKNQPFLTSLAFSHVPNDFHQLFVTDHVIYANIFPSVQGFDLCPVCTPVNAISWKSCTESATNGHFPVVWSPATRIPTVWPSKYCIHQYSKRMEER